MALFTVDTSAEKIQAEMLSEVPDTYQKTVGFIIWDTFRAISIGLMKVWDLLKYISTLDDLRNLNYDDLVRWVKQRRNIIAREETYATGQLQLVTGAGTIQAGALFETPDGLQFESVDTVTLTEGDLFTVKCLTAGIIGNVPENTITVIPVTITGVVKVTNPEATAGGYEKESKESIIERYEEDLQKPITSGNIYHYKKWAKEVTGVGDADIKPLWDGDNTVKVIIIDSNMETAPQSLVDSVQQYIDPYTLVEGVKKGWGCGNGQAPIGAYCTVASATALDLNITADIILKTGATLEEVEASVTEKIKAYLKSIAFKEDINYVSYARIGGELLASDGVLDYSNLLINGSTDNISILNTETNRAVAILESLNLEVAS